MDYQPPLLRKAADEAKVFMRDALKMAQAGANRSGASASVAIVTGKGDGKSKGY